MKKDSLTVTTPQGFELEILFRQLMKPVPCGWREGKHWAVEAYEFGNENPPIGFCWVMDPSFNTTTRQRIDNFPPHLEYVRVF